MKNDLQNTNWEVILELHRDDVDNSWQSFFSIIKSIIDKYAPLKRIWKNVFACLFSVHNTISL